MGSAKNETVNYSFEKDNGMPDVAVDTQDIASQAEYLTTEQFNQLKEVAVLQERPKREVSSLRHMKREKALALLGLSSTYFDAANQGEEEAAQEEEDANSKLLPWQKKVKEQEQAYLQQQAADRTFIVADDERQKMLEKLGLKGSHTNGQLKKKAK